MDRVLLLVLLLVLVLEWDVMTHRIQRADRARKTEYEYEYRDAEYE